MTGDHRADGNGAATPLDRRTLTAWTTRLTTSTVGPDLARLLAERPGLGPRESDTPTTEKNTQPPIRSQALIESITARQKLIAHLTAEQTHDLTELSRSYPGIWEFLPTELAIALGISDQAAAGRLNRAEQLVDHLPHTLAAVHRGDLTPDKAELIRRLTADIPTPLCALIEQDVLPQAPQQPMLKLENAVRRAILRHDPVGAEERRIKATRARHIRITRLPDEMASLYFVSDAVDLAIIKTCFDEHARLTATPDDTRTADARRVDVLVDLCAEARHRLNNPEPGESNQQGGDDPTAATPPAPDQNTGSTDDPTGQDAETEAPADIPAIPASNENNGPVTSSGTAAADDNAPGHHRAPGTGHTLRQARRHRGTATIGITVPHDVLQGLHGTCELSGYGPIGATHALRLFTPDAEYLRLVTEPLTGKLLDYNRTRYVPPDWLKQFVKHRDQTCRAPGCHQPAAKCEIDHVVPYRHGGKTNAADLLSLCKHHHRGKDGGEHTATIDDHGDSWWTTPLGHTRMTAPANLNPEPTQRRFLNGGPLKPDTRPVDRDLPPDAPPPY